MGTLPRRRFLGAALASAVIAGVPHPGRAADVAAAAAALRRARGGNLTSLDPHRPISAADMEIAADLFVGLTAIDARGAIVSGCAARWSVSPDGLRYEFLLRRGLRWSDGEPLTAADFVASYPAAARAVDRCAARLPLRRDPRRARGAHRRRAAGSLGVSAPDAGPCAASNSSGRTPTSPSSRPVAYVVPTHLVARLGRDWAKPPSIAVNGAWLPRSWSQNGTLALVRNGAFHAADGFPRAPGQLEWVMGIDDATRLRLFRAGGLDVAQLTEGVAARDRAARAAGTRCARVPFYGGGWVGLNTRRGVLRDPRVRRRSRWRWIARRWSARCALLGERATESVVPEAVADYPRRAVPAHAGWPMPRRLAAARELLREAGHRPRSSAAADGDLLRESADAAQLPGAECDVVAARPAGGRPRHGIARLQRSAVAARLRPDGLRAVLGGAKRDQLHRPVPQRLVPELHGLRRTRRSTA